MFHKMVQKLVSTLSGRTLILVERIEHGDALADLIPGALWVRGQDNSETRNEVIEKFILNKHPIKKFVNEESIGKLALFLASHAASMITGTAIPIDGGWVAQ